MDSSPYKFNLAGDANPLGRGLSQPVSIHAEHQLNSPGDIGKAHQFFQPAQAGNAAIGQASVGNAAIGQASVGNAAVGNAALGRAAVAPGAGLEGLTAKAIAQLQAQVSPMIQLIMRMPGHIGLMSSAFEAFANFFMPHVNMIGGLDHSLLTAHMEAANSSLHDVAGGAGSEHIATDMHLLPHDAPILHELHLEGAEGVGSAAGEHGFNLSYVNEDLLFDKGSLNVAGTLDAAKPQFDGISFTDSHGEILSGPTLSSASPATHLASSGHHAVFEKALSHGGGASAHMNSALATNSTDPVSSTMSQSLPLNSASGGMNVGSNAFGQGNLPAAPSSSNVVNAPSDAGAGTSYGASGVGSDQLGGNNQLLAMNKTGAGDMHGISNAPGAANASEYNYGDYNHAQAASSATKGLHAKGLTLDSVKGGHTTGDAHAASTDANSHAHTADKHIASADKHAATTEKHIDHKVEAKAVDHKQVAEAIKDKAAAAKSAVSQAAKPAAHAAQSTVAKVATPKVETVASTDSRAAVVAEAPAPATDATAAPTTGADNAATGNDAASTTDVTYTIKAGDNLWNIAKDNLHNATKWQDIYKMNADVLGSNPGMIHAGTTIHLPGTEHAIASTGEATKYVVKSGDNLWNLAKHNMGDGSKWSEIYKLNHDVIGANPDLIRPGQELTFNAPAPGGEAGSLADASVAAPAGVPTEAVAAAPQQLASAPMSSSAPAEFGQPEAVGQFGSPADSQVTLAPSQQAVEQATAAPMDPVMPPQSALPQAGAANAMQPSSAALQPGAAGAATLSHPTPVNNVVPGPDSPDRASVVSSNLLGNLQDFLGHRK
jgi:nucleoid-associated protein YgaU